MKKLFGIIAIVAIAAAGWNFNQSKNEVELSDLALANVEALANNQSGGKNNKSLAQKANGDYCCAKNDGNN